MRERTVDRGANKTAKSSFPNQHYCTRQHAKKTTERCTRQQTKITEHKKAIIRGDEAREYGS